MYNRCTVSQTTNTYASYLSSSARFYKHNCIVTFRVTLFGLL